MTRAAQPPIQGDGSVAVLAGVVLLDALSFSLMLPLLPGILSHYGAGSIVAGGLVAIHALSSAAAGPLLGQLSDRCGRKPVILGTLLVAAGAYMLLGSAHDLPTLFIGRALAGAAAGNLGVVRAAAADRTTITGQTQTMGLLNAGGALGYVLGPAMGAAIGTTSGQTLLWVGVIGVASSITAALMVLRWLHERPHAPAVTRNRRGAKLGGDRLLLLSFMASGAFAEAGLVSVTPFWSRATLGWSAREIGALFAWVSAAIVISQIAVVSRLARAVAERVALRILLAGCFTGLILLIAAPRSLLVVVSAAPIAFIGLTAIQTLSLAMLSKTASPEERGGLLGAASGATATARVAGPSICGVLFARINVAAPYWTVALLIGTWLVWFIAHSNSPAPSDGALPGAEART